jgi:hypothetical protein
MQPRSYGDIIVFIMVGVNKIHLGVFTAIEK